MFKKNLFLIITILIFFLGCSQNEEIDTEDKLTGVWKTIEDKCDSNLYDISEDVTFYNDNTMSGIENFQYYKLEDSNHENYDYIILKDIDNETQKFKFNITESKNLEIRNDTYNGDFKDNNGCHLRKTNIRKKKIGPF